MRGLISIASIALLFTGCAEFFGSRSKDAYIHLQVPSFTRRDVMEDTQHVVELVGGIAERHGLTRIAERPTPEGKTLVVVPGYQGPPWPGQPDVDWGPGPSWKLVLKRAGYVSDTVECTVLAPRTGRVLIIMAWTHYQKRSPAVMEALWRDVKAALEDEFGRQAFVECKDLK